MMSNATVSSGSLHEKYGRIFMSEIYWIKNGNDNVERLAIVARPRGNEWLADDLQSLRQQGLDVLISFLEPYERDELGLSEESILAKQKALQYLNYPIPDRQIPSSLWESRDFIQQVVALLSDGHSVGVHCRQSVGRSGFMTAAILVEAGETVNGAFTIVEQARGRSVPDTEEQREWVHKYAKMKAFFGAEI